MSPLCEFLAGNYIWSLNFDSIQRTLYKSLREQIQELDHMGYDMERLSKIKEPDAM